MSMVIKMSKQIRVNLEHAPTLGDLLTVEDTLQKMDESLIKISDLRRKLPKQINYTNLRKIIWYLDQINKIAVTKKGITWIASKSISKKLRTKLKKAVTV